MKRLISSVAVGAFAAANALSLHAAAFNEWAIGGTAFQGYSDQNGITHNGNGVTNNSGATHGVTGTITLNFPTSVLLTVQVYVYGPNASGSACDVWVASNNGASQSGWGMTKSGTATAAVFGKTSVSINSQSQTLSVFCNLTNGSTLAILKTFS
jgi:hypothetical protein